MVKSALIVAHRGLSSLYPENTLIAFKKAVKLGVDFIELDVHVTNGGELVVIHDDTLDRTTDGCGQISQLTLSKIKRYSAGKWFSSSFKKEKVPTLREVFELTKKRTKLLIEIKQSGIEKRLLDLIREYNMTDNVICGSFSLETVAKIRRLNPSIPVAFITDSIDMKQIDDLLRKGINMINVNFRNITVDIIKKCYSYGFAIGVWTPDKETDLKKILKIGATAITTNYPQRLKRLMRGHQ